MRTIGTMTAVALVAAVASGCGNDSSATIDGAIADARVETPPVDPVASDAIKLVGDGREVFRHDTFGDEAFWGGTLGLHRTIAGEANGGVGPGLSPVTALSLGLKVDVDSVPADIAAGIANGTVDLNDPASTLALLKANAVVGVTGFFTGDQMTSVGIQCALCHSTVDDSFAPGIGHRLDGWANRDLDVGSVVAFAPDLSIVAGLLAVDQDTVRTVLHSWGPGKYDAELLLDGKAFRPDGGPAATLIPPAFGLAGVNLHTWTGWGSVPYWNAFVATTQMHGVGNFFDPRLDDASKFPIAAAAGFGHLAVDADEDRVSAKLPALQMYQLALVAPAPPAGSFDADAAERGDALFEGKARCASCHVEGAYAESGWAMHTAAELGVDDFQAMRSPDGMYRTPPLHGLWTHTRGGFYHDGRFATLADVVDHYNSFMELGLTAGEKGDVVEYLKSL